MSKSLTPKMMNRLLLTSGLCLIIRIAASQTIIAAFAAPDTVCVNQTFTIQNTSSGSVTSSYWSFCMGNNNTAPVATNMGNPGNQLSWPVYYSIARENGNFHAFVINNAFGELVRLDYGTSLLNTPVVTNLGNLGGLPSNLEDMHLEFQNGSWYGIIVGGMPGKILTVNFGNSLTNTPTLVDHGNVGNLSYPQKLEIYNSGGTYYGFTVSRNNSTITRFSFGTSISSVPTGTNLGNIGSLAIGTDISIILYNGNWYGYVINEGDSTLTRLDFGNSLQNTPTGINLGNTGGLRGPRGIDVWVECGVIRGLITNRYGHHILKMNFMAGPAGPITTTSYGNIGNMAWPHSIERFRVGDTLYAMIPNVGNNTLTRIFFPNCINSSIPTSTSFSPPPVAYNQPGTYFISYTANETAINQAVYCKQIVAVNAPTLSVQSKTICLGAKVTLTATGATTYSWSTAHTGATLQLTPTITTVYTVTGSSGGACRSTATVQVKVTPCEGLQDFGSNIGFGVYPNPSSGRCIITTAIAAKFQLADAYGRVVGEGMLTGENNYTAILRDLPQGCYFITVTSAGRSQARRLIVTAER